MHELKRSLRFWSFWICFSIALFYLAGCESSKNLEKTSSKTEAETKIDSSAYFHEQINQLQRNLEEEKRSKKTGITFNPPRQPVLMHVPGEELIDDCPPCPANEIHIKTDGSITAKGDIGSFSLQEDHYRRQISELIDERERETSLRMETEYKLKEAEKNKTVAKEFKIMHRWWMWFLAGAITVLGIWIYFSYQAHKVKKLTSVESLYKNIMQ